MKNTCKYLISIAAFFLFINMLVSCKKDDVVPVPVVIKEATDVNKFIYNGL